MSKTLHPGQMSDRALEDYIQSHQLDSDEIYTAHKEYTRRWRRSLLRKQWPVLLVVLTILFSLLLWVAFAIQDRKASDIVLPFPDSGRHVVVP